VADALANRARELVVGPGAGAGLRVGRDVGAREKRHVLQGHVAAGAERAGDGDEVVVLVVVRVAEETARDVVDEVGAAGQAGRCGLEGAVGERAGTRAENGSPADGGRDDEGDEDDERGDGDERQADGSGHTGASGTHGNAGLGRARGL